MIAAAAALAAWLAEHDIRLDEVELVLRVPTRERWIIERAFAMDHQPTTLGGSGVNIDGVRLRIETTDQLAPRTTIVFRDEVSQL